MDTRSLINRIQKRVNFKILPEFHKTSNPISFLIFLLTFIECKHSFKHFFELYSKINISNYPDLFFCSIPRSGTNYIINLYKTAVELLNEKSGCPLYNQETDAWEYEMDLDGYSTDMRNLLYSLKLKRSFDKYTCKESTLHPLSVFHAHHPIQAADLVDMSSVRPIIALRNINDIVKSWYFYSHASSAEYYVEDNVGREKWHLISKLVDQVVDYYNYWGVYTEIQEPGEDYFIIKYEELVENPLQVLKHLFKYCRIEINEIHLKNAIELNSYENTKKYILNSGTYQTRRITIRKKPDFTEELISMINEKKDRYLKYNFGYI